MVDGVGVCARWSEVERDGMARKEGGVQKEARNKGESGARGQEENRSTRLDVQRRVAIVA